MNQLWLVLFGIVFLAFLVWFIRYIQPNREFTDLEIGLWLAIIRIDLSNRSLRAVVKGDFKLADELREKAAYLSKIDKSSFTKEQIVFFNKLSEDLSKGRITKNNMMTAVASMFEKSAVPYN